MPGGGVMDRREASPWHAPKAVVETSAYPNAELSQMIGRPNPYLAVFVRIGKPAALIQAEHRRLVDFFGLEERALGAR